MNLLLTLFFLPALLFWHLAKTFNKSLPNLNGGSILVIAVGGIGDTLLALPCVKALRQNCEGTKITVWTSDSSMDFFFREEELVDSLVIYPFHQFFRPLHFFFENIKFLWKIRSREFSQVIITEPCHNIISSVAAFLSGAKIRIGPRYRLGKIDDTDFLLTHSLPFSYEKHALEMNLELLGFFGIKDISPCLTLPLLEEDKTKTRLLLEKHGVSVSELLVGMHIGANPNQLYKCWDQNKYAVILDFLIRECQAKVVVTGGEGEKTQVSEMIHLAKTKPVNLVGKLGIQETAGLLERCNLFVTNDSGPMHMAASVKTPVVAIFGPTHPKKNAPFGRHILVRKELDCSPCYDWKFSRIKDCPHLKCLRDLSVDEVKSAIEKMLGNKTHATTH